MTQKRHIAFTPVLKVPEVADRLRKSSKTVWRMIKSRQFQGVRKVGRDYLVPVAAVEALERKAALFRRAA